ncbi:DUF1810 domain-containing protein [Novosphingobium album (ex Hu et al. 2023)]|uniref:DUF1810 domain-containing protein n=1 Tax=Novosphingobium album (ex Hu et al. 2023) TaxID=2930093 RepID=A0ABT0B3W0_9SPHN|nr:DUF1810 domain-containing protein [Novosphingobium album (ex Hu et al. 2023)]MCJ2179734.1 DUF1810 domain-containing protein [Novosphingobium album (ex Hu et al. 2023)]
MNGRSGLERFVVAQRDIYAQALDELRGGAKHSHWMWFVFPQIAGLGHSPTARFYAITGLEEARAYLAHSLLSARLTECTDAMLDWCGKRSAETILGMVDALKFRSSMTLFEAATDSAGSQFGQALDGFCNGSRDQRTLDLLGTASRHSG